MGSKSDKKIRKIHRFLFILILTHLLYICFIKSHIDSYWINIYVGWIYLIVGTIGVAYELYILWKDNFK